MSTKVTVTCDFCGRHISDEPFVTLELRGDSEWTKDFHETSCYEQVEGLMSMLRERAGFLGDIPVATETEMLALRPAGCTLPTERLKLREMSARAEQPLWESYMGCGLPHRIKRALVEVGLDFETALAMPDKQLRHVPGLGPVGIECLRAVSDHTNNPTGDVSR
jgi:hypothetical protein